MEFQVLEVQFSRILDVEGVLNSCSRQVGVQVQRSLSLAVLSIPRQTHQRTETVVETL